MNKPEERIALLEEGLEIGRLLEKIEKKRLMLIKIQLMFIWVQLIISPPLIGHGIVRWITHDKLSGLLLALLYAFIIYDGVTTRNKALSQRKTIQTQLKETQDQIVHLESFIQKLKTQNNESTTDRQ
jgi:hypothetical protein